MKTPPLDPQSLGDFLKLSAGFEVAATLGGARLMAQNSPAGGPAPTSAKPIPLVRVGFVGVGVKGTEHLANLLSLPGVELRAVCDIDEAASTRAQQLTEKAGQRKPTAYTSGVHDFERMCATRNWISSIPPRPGSGMCRSVSQR